MHPLVRSDVAVAGNGDRVGSSDASGYLLLRSRFVPRVLPVLLAPAFVAELALPVWLLVKDVDFHHRKQQVAA